MPIRVKTTIERISKKAGRKITFCKCESCKSQCRRSPCLGTPEDILRLIEKGFIDEIVSSLWVAGINRGVDTGINMYQISHNNHKGCVFFKDGLCQLHTVGLKPTEGKLTHHTIQIDNYNFKKSPTYLVAIEWIEPANYPTIEAISKKMEQAGRETIVTGSTIKL